MKFALPFIVSAIALAGLAKVIVCFNPVDVPASALRKNQSATPVLTATASK